MCDFCHKHGDGKRWYLEAKNYSDDLLHDPRRQAILKHIAEGAFSEDKAEELRGELDKMAQLDRLPRPIQSLAKWWITRKMKRDHFGQVVPIEDMEKILQIVTTIVRIPCVCRHVTTRGEHYYCLGVSVKPDLGEVGKMVDAIFGDDGPDVSQFEQPSREQALQLMSDWERDGIVHTVWTFGTPFIGGICNCDRSDCLAMRATVVNDVKVMWRGEYVAQVDWDRCTGCRACMRVCQFGALGFSAASQKAYVDLRKCYGCGVCRAVCPKDAVQLVERASVPEVAEVW